MKCRRAEESGRVEKCPQKSRSVFILLGCVSCRVVCHCTDWNSAIYSLFLQTSANLMGVKSKPFNRLFIVCLYVHRYKTICHANYTRSVCVCRVVVRVAGDACDCTFRLIARRVREGRRKGVNEKAEEKRNSHDEKLRAVSDGSKLSR